MNKVVRLAVASALCAAALPSWAAVTLTVASFPDLDRDVKNGHSAVQKAAS